MNTTLIEGYITLDILFFENGKENLLERRHIIIKYLQYLNELEELIIQLKLELVKKD